jgi:hypothetical protein
MDNPYNVEYYIAIINELDELDDIDEEIAFNGLFDRSKWMLNYARELMRNNYALSYSDAIKQAGQKYLMLRKKTKERSEERDIIFEMYKQVLMQHYYYSIILIESLKVENLFHRLPKELLKVICDFI